jgi:hypothetical protein
MSPRFVHFLAQGNTYTFLLTALAETLEKGDDATLHSMAQTSGRERS